MGNHKWFIYKPFYIFYLLFFLLILLLSIVSSFIETFWRLNGKEIVEITSEGISIRHQVFVFGITKNFSAEKIPCIFISRRKDHWFITAMSREMRFHNFKRGKIAFNSGKTFFGEIITYRFGSILDSDEAWQVINIIREKFPQYKCPAKSAG